VQIPLVQVREFVSATSAPLVANGDLQGLRILVVDDETDSREFVAFVLEQAGAVVTDVGSGGEALRVLAQSELDLIISDIGMPEMDGYMLIQQVRAPESWPESAQPESAQLVQQLEQEPVNQLIPAIALTAYAGEFDRQQALAAGFQCHFAKPVEATALIAAAAELCGRGGSTR
jgi:CheY-like chemotaxis protein